MQSQSLLPRMWKLLLVASVLSVAVGASAQTATPTSTPTATSTATPTSTPTFTPTSTPTPQATKVTDADSLMASGSQDVNYGSADNLLIGDDNGGKEDTRTILKFDLSGVTGLNTEDTILRAILQLEVRAVSAGLTDVRAFRVTKNNWVELQVTWNHYKTGSEWISDGGDYSDPNSGTYSCTGTGTVYWDVTDQVQDAVARRAKIVHLLLKSDTEGSTNICQFESAESTPGVEPVLKFNWATATPGGGTFTPTPTVTPTNTNPPKSGTGVEDLTPWLDANVATETQIQPSIGPDGTTTFHKIVMVLDGEKTDYESFRSIIVSPTFPQPVVQDNSCTGVLIKADAENVDTVWISPWLAVNATEGASLPLDPASSLFIKAPNSDLTSGLCSGIHVIGGSNCSFGAKNCKVYAISQ